MRLFQISAGLNPVSTRSNNYLDALPLALAAHGHDVTRLHMAEIGPWNRRMYIERTKDTIQTITVRNSGVYASLPPGGGVGSAQPLRDVFAPTRLRSALKGIARELRPDVVHIQNLFGFPAELVADLQDTGAAVVFTAHDFSAICATSHLFKPEGENCNLARDQLTCSRCCEASMPYTLFRIIHGLNSRLETMRQGSPSWNALARLRNGLLKSNRKLRRVFTTDESYRQRFDAMRAMLQRLEIVHCISRRQASRLQESVGKLPRLRVLPLVPPTVAKRNPLPRTRAMDAPLCFAVLNVLPGRLDKGWDFLHGVLARLEQVRHDFRIDWYAEGIDTQCIRHRGRYSHSDIDRIAAESDFCIIPSLSNETLGFTGVEMLARGVPLVCSNRCGVAEWVRNGETGLIFDPGNPDELYTTLVALLDTPTRAAALRSAQVEACTHMPVFNDHVEAMSLLLQESVANIAAR